MKKGKNQDNNYIEQLVKKAKNKTKKHFWGASQSGLLRYMKTEIKERKNHSDKDEKKVVPRREVSLGAAR